MKGLKERLYRRLTEIIYWRLPEVEAEVVRVTIKKMSRTATLGLHPQILGGEHMELQDQVKIGNYVRLQTIPSPQPSKPPLLLIRKGASLENNVTITCTEKVDIQENAMIAGGVYLSDHSHRYDEPSTPIKKQPLKTGGALIVGAGSHIGQNAVVFGKVRVGQNSVVGANSVVTHDVPDHSIVAGVPARIIKRYNFSSKKWERAS